MILKSILSFLLFIKKNIKNYRLKQELILEIKYLTE